jgi:molybdate transport system substrate-binding protein
MRDTLLAAALLLAVLASPTGARSAEITVMISGGFSAAYEKLLPEFERASGHKVVTLRGPSMGETPQAIPNRLARGEPADVVILVG